MTTTTTLHEMLRGSLWAPALTPDELQLVSAECYERRVAAGGFIVRRGETAESWNGVITGFAKMAVSQPDGRASTFTGVTAGAWFGEGTLLRGGIYRYDAVAVRETRVACMPRASFERLLRSNFAFNRMLLGLLNARLSLFISLVEYDRLLGPEARVARCLASLFDPELYPRTDPLLLVNQEEIGLLAGVSRQRANTALHELQREGLLRLDFGGVTVLDVAKLRAYRGQPRGAAERAAAKPATNVEDWT